MNLIDGVVSDRGSKYAVSGAPVRTRADIDAFLKALRRKKKFARATHHSWGAVLGENGPAKGDDGESGAGQVILRMLDRHGVEDHVIVVTRWYGGTRLGGDRFRRVQDCVRAYLDTFLPG